VTVVLDKAATLTGDDELTYASFPIEKIEQAADGSVMVWGKATDDSVDSDEQIIDAAFAAKALAGWMASGPNVRVQHQAQRDPAGVGVTVEKDGTAHWVKSRIIEPVAKSLVLGGALRAYSVGIARPTIQRDPTARGGRITDGSIVEISLVDRPANKNCGIQLVKADKSGNAEWIGKVFGSDDMIAKALSNSPAVEDVTVSLPSDVQVSFSPLDLAKIVARKQADPAALLTKQVQAGVVSVDEARGKLGLEPWGLPETGPDYESIGKLEDAAFIVSLREAGADDEVVKAHRKFSAEQRRDQASSGNALPDGSYPIPDTDALRRAAILARSGHGDASGAKKLIARRARELGVPNPLKGGKKDGKAAAKAAAAVANEATPDMTKPTEKKEKAACNSCGAMQNNQHAFCSECGQGMAGAMPIAKNHDFMCLGCGKTLDKGEKFCPDCGKENPGYLPEADQKVPSNKAEGSRVAEAAAAEKGMKTKPKKGKGKKGMPFGGNQATPFGKDKDDEAEKASGQYPASGMTASDGGSAMKDAAVTDSSMTATGGGAAIKGKKNKGFGSTASPGAGVTGEGAAGIATVPAHREPDGLDVAAFEHDAGLPTDSAGDRQSIPVVKGKGKLGGKKSSAIAVDTSAPGRRGKAKKAKGPKTGTTPPAAAGVPSDSMPVPGHRSADENQMFDRDMGKTAGDPQIATNMVLKSLGVSQEDGFLHDLSCPAFSYEDVMKAYPDGLATFSAKSWQDNALQIAATAPLAQAKAAVMLGQHAYTLKGADVNDLHDVKNDMYKAFRDANPGPGSFPSPGEVRAQQFTRPNITSGRASYGFHYDGPNSAKVPDHSMAASQFGRGFMQSGNAQDSPANKSGAPYPSETGAPVHLDYSSVHKGNILDALHSMHDHFDRIMPSGVCPLAGQATTPPPHSLVPAQKTEDDVAVTKEVSPDGMSKGMRKKMRKKLTKKVMSGKMPLDTARIRMGKKPKKSPDPLKPQKAAEPDIAKTITTELRAAKFSGLTKKDLRAALVKARKTSDKKLAALTRTVDALASQPDPGTQPFKGMALNPIRKSASPAGVQDIASVAERTQMMVLRELEETARNSTDSGTREAAWNQVLKLKGLIA